MSVSDDSTAAAKACSKCGTVKALTDFPPDRRKKDGRQAACRECDRLSSAAYRAANPGKNKEVCDAWQSANVARTRAYRVANAERRRATTAAWQAANRDAVRVYDDRRRARKLGALVVDDRVFRARVWERDGGRCHICGKKADPKKWHMDHIVPLVAGGEHSYRNVSVSHPICNLRKGKTGPAQLRLEG